VNAAMLGWLRKNEVLALDCNGYRSTKVSSKAKSRRQENRKGIETRSGFKTVKAHMPMLDVSLSTSGVTEGKGRDKLASSQPHLN
jgi:hypothetical protein